MRLPAENLKSMEGFSSRSPVVRLPPRMPALPKLPSKPTAKAAPKAAASVAREIQAPSRSRRNVDPNIQRDSATGSWGRQLATPDAFMATVGSTFHGTTSSPFVAPSQIGHPVAMNPSVPTTQEISEGRPLAAETPSMPSPVGISQGGLLAATNLSIPTSPSISRVGQAEPEIPLIPSFPNIDLLDGPAEDISNTSDAQPTSIQNTVTATEAVEAQDALFELLQGESAPAPTAVEGVRAEQFPYVGDLEGLDMAEPARPPSLAGSIESRIQHDTSQPVSQSSVLELLTTQEIMARLGPNIGSFLARGTLDRMKKLIDDGLAAFNTDPVPSIQTQTTRYIHEGELEAAGGDKGAFASETDEQAIPLNKSHPTSKTAEQPAAKVPSSTAAQLNTVQETFTRAVAEGTIDTSEFIIGESLYAVGNRRSGSLASSTASSVIAVGTRNPFGPTTSTVAGSRWARSSRRASSASLPPHPALNVSARDDGAAGRTNVAPSLAASNITHQTLSHSTAHADPSNIGAPFTRDRGASFMRGRGIPAEPTLPAHLVNIARSNDPGAAAREQYGGARGSGLALNPFGPSSSIPSTTAADHGLDAHGSSISPALAGSVQPNHPSAVVRERYEGTHGGTPAPSPFARPQTALLETAGGGRGRGASPVRGFGALSSRGRGTPSLPAHLAGVTPPSDTGAAVRQQYGGVHGGASGSNPFGQAQPAVFGTNTGRDPDTLPTLGHGGPNFTCSSR